MTFFGKIFRLRGVATPATRYFNPPMKLIFCSILEAKFREGIKAIVTFSFYNAQKHAVRQRNTDGLHNLIPRVRVQKNH